MKIIRGLVALAAAGALTLGVAPPASAAPDDLVSIPDGNLQWCISDALGVEQAESYTEEQLESIEGLSCYADDLTGLEHAAALTDFSNYGWDLTSIAPLAPLTHLTSLELSSNQPIDLNPLAGKSTLVTLRLDGGAANLSTMPNLPELTELYIGYGDVPAIPSLPLPKLTSLTARGTGLTNISGLSSLPELTTLDLRWNQITSIPSSLSLPKLQQADLSGSDISSIATLPAMPALQRLDLDYNKLTTLPALNLPKLDWLGLAHNQISSISATTKLPELDAMSLVGNKLTNIAPLKSYSKLSTLFVNGNQISDLSNLTTSYPFKGQLHATRQRLTDSTVRACTAVPLRTVKGAPDSKHPIVWTLPPGVIRSASNIIYPESSAGSTHRVQYSQLGRFTRSDSRDDVYFSGSYYHTVVKPTAILAPTPTISGSVKYRSRVAVRAGSWCPAATKLSYQWLRNGAPISKATGAAYTLTLSDVGKKISVRVTGTRTGLKTIVKTSAQKVVAKATLGAKTPSITGTAKKGKTLKVKTAAWTPAPVKLSYQWLRNGKAISKATKSSYTLTSKDKGKYVSVKVTGSKSGYTTTSRTSAKTAKIT